MKTSNAKVNVKARGAFISGMGVTWFSNNTVAGLPEAGLSPTIKPYPFDSMNTELRLGFPTNGGEGIYGYQANPFQ